MINNVKNLKSTHSQLSVEQLHAAMLLVVNRLNLLPLQIFVVLNSSIAPPPIPKE